MDQAALKELPISIRQADHIRCSTLKPSRVITFRRADVKNVREKNQARQT